MQLYLDNKNEHVTFVILYIQFLFPA